LALEKEWEEFRSDFVGPFVGDNDRAHAIFLHRLS
jgi:hypothetical protein